MPSIKAILNQTIDPLDAEVLLAYVLNKPKEYLFTNCGLRIADSQAQKFLKLVKKRQAGWPVAYLTHQKEFFGRKFFINRNVLIPRPETEGLVELLNQKIKDLRLRIKDKKTLSILDLGTGSGCITIALAHNLNPTTYNLNLFASDISSKALLVAKKNARLAFGSPRRTKQHGVKITFKQGDLLKPWGKKNFDIIIANLPYGWNAWKNNTSAETIGLKFEPQEALFTTNNGLALYEKLFKQIASRVIPAKAGIQKKSSKSGSPIKACPRLDRGSGMTHEPRFIFLEFDPRQLKQLKNLVRKYLPGYDTKTSKDLAGRIRYAMISLAQQN